MKKLQLDKKNKILFGTCAGIAKCFNMNPIYIRNFILLLTLVPLVLNIGISIWVIFSYVIATLCMIKQIDLVTFILMILFAPILVGSAVIAIMMFFQ